MLTEIALVINTVVALFFLVAWVREARKREFAEHVMGAVNRSKDDLAKAHLDLVTRYERVQRGYDQGVLEGMRQAYVNVRATLADELFMLGAPYGPKIRAFVLPLLSELGKHETRLLDEMKGQTKDRLDFDLAITDKPAINVFPGNNKPQGAKEVPVGTPVLRADALDDNITEEN